jgi:hypothetical protein
MPYPINIDLGDQGGVYRIRSAEEFKAMLDEQINNWSGLGQLVQRTPNYQGVLTDLQGAWNQSVQAINMVRVVVDQGRPEQAA